VSYNAGQKVSISVAVLSGSAPASGVAVQVNIVKSDGSIVAVQGTTGPTGVAVVGYQSKKNDPKGMWQATGSSNGASARATFTVQ